jgi:hypothetical protein
LMAAAGVGLGEQAARHGAHEFLRGGNQVSRTDGPTKTCGV